MRSKTTLVTLECAALNVTQDFEISHAERLLMMRNNGGWKLPKESNFEFTKDGIKYRTDKKTDNREKEKVGNQ